MMSRRLRFPFLLQTTFAGVVLAGSFALASVPARADWQLAHFKVTYDPADHASWVSYSDGTTANADGTEGDAEHVTSKTSANQGTYGAPAWAPPQSQGSIAKVRVQVTNEYNFSGHHGDATNEQGFGLKISFFDGGNTDASDDYGTDSGACASASVATADEYGDLGIGDTACAGWEQFYQTNYQQSFAHHINSYTATVLGNSADKATYWAAAWSEAYGECDGSQGTYSANCHATVTIGDPKPIPAQ